MRIGTNVAAIVANNALQKSQNNQHQLKDYHQDTR